MRVLYIVWKLTTHGLLSWKYLLPNCDLYLQSILILKNIFFQSFLLSTSSNKQQKWEGGQTAHLLVSTGLSHWPSPAAIPWGCILPLFGRQQRPCAGPHQCQSQLSLRQPWVQDERLMPVKAMAGKPGTQRNAGNVQSMLGARRVCWEPSE